jgi:hypothetical protein
MNQQQLKEKLQAIEKKCQHWKSCQDGSYEMALHNSGYFRVLEQLKELRNETLPS